MNNVQKAAVIAHIGDARKPEDQPSPIGTDRGTFERNPCGECWHWKRARNGTLDQGTCMNGPPVAFPIQTKQGMSLALTRPVLPASHEGCDDWDDELPPEDGEEVQEPTRAGGTA